MGAPLGHDIIEGLEGMVQRKRARANLDPDTQYRQLGYLYMLVWILIIVTIVWHYLEFMEFMKEPPEDSSNGYTMGELINCILNF